MSAPHDPYAPWRHVSYRYFVAGRIVFLLGVMMQGVTVSWLVYQQLRDDTKAAAVALGLIGLAQVVPILLFSLPAGHAADRFDRRRLALAGQGTILLGGVGVYLTTLLHGPVWCYYAALFTAAVGRAFNIPAYSALLTQLLPRDAVPKAMAWNSTAFQISSMVGPALGGIVVGAATPQTACLVNLVFFAAGYFCFSRAKPTGSGEAAPDARKAPVTLHGLLSGVRFVFKTRLLLAMLLLDLFATLLGGATALMPIYAHDILHVDAVGFGLLRAAPSVGAILMALWMIHRPEPGRAGPMLVASVAGYGLVTVVFGVSTSFWLSVALLVVVGACDNAGVVIRQTVDQMLTPSGMRGRVSAFSFIFVSCSNELGEVESGLSAAWLGPVGSVVAGGLGALVVLAGAVWTFPELLRLGRLRELTPERVEAETGKHLEEVAG